MYVVAAITLWWNEVNHDCSSCNDLLCSRSVTRTFFSLLYPFIVYVAWEKTPRSRHIITQANGSHIRHLQTNHSLSVRTSFTNSLSVMTCHWTPYKKLVLYVIYITLLSIDELFLVVLLQSCESKVELCVSRDQCSIKGLVITPHYGFHFDTGVINSSHGHIRLGSSVLRFYTFIRFHQFSTSTVRHILQVSSVLFIETITGFCRSPYPRIHQVLSVFYIKRTTRSPGVASSSHAYIRQVSPVFHVDSSTRSPGFINLHIDTFNRFRQLSISWVQHWYNDVSLSSLSEHQMQYLNTASLTWTHVFECRKAYFSC